MVIGDKVNRLYAGINCEAMRCPVGLIQMMMAAKVMSKDEHRVILTPKTSRVTHDVTSIMTCLLIQDSIFERKEA
jgi:hypothetical protein